MIKKPETASELKQEETGEHKILQKSVGIETFVSDCLEKEQLDDSCKLLFSDLDIWEECAALDEPDRCYYGIALFQLDPDLCSKIMDDNLMKGCEEELETCCNIE